MPILLYYLLYNIMCYEKKKKKKKKKKKLETGHPRASHACYAGSEMNIINNGYESIYVQTRVCTVYDPWAD